MIIVNDRAIDWHPGMTLADAVRAYQKFDPLVFLHPDLMMIIESERYSDKEAESVTLEDETRVILMYEFWGG